MLITPQERTLLTTLHPRLGFEPRFLRLPSQALVGDREQATTALIEKGVLARLADGEYWLTDYGTYLLDIIGHLPEGR